MLSPPRDCTLGSEPLCVPVVLVLVNLPVVFLLHGWYLASLTVLDDAVTLTWVANLPLLGCLILAILGNLILYRSITQVSTRLRHSVKQCDMQQQRLHSLLETAADGVLLLDAHGRVESVNKAALQMLGHPEETLVGQPLSRFLRSGQPGPGRDDSSRPVDLLDLQQQQALGRAQFLQALCADGRCLPVSVAISKPDSIHPPIHIAILHDLSELALAQRRAEAANRATSAFLGNISHEFRTPLHHIVGIVDLLRETTPMTAQQSELLNTLNRSAGSLQNLVERVMELCQLEAGKIEPQHHAFSLSGLIQQVVTPHRAVARARGLALSSQLSPSLPDTLVGDSGKLARALAQLLDNAIKFTPRGSIELTVLPDSTATAAAPVVPLLIEIRDTGIGIEPAIQDEIFAPFEQGETTLTRHYSGAGLGLSLASALIQIMGGELTLVESHPGSGSRFRIRLQLPQASPGSPAGDQSGPCVLIVHGDQRIPQALNDALKSQSWQVVCCQDQQVGLTEYLDAIVQGDLFQLIIVDDSLPDCSPGEWLHHLAAVGSVGHCNQTANPAHCPVLVLSDDPCLPILPDGVTVLGRSAGVSAFREVLLAAGSSHPRNPRTDTPVLLPERRASRPGTPLAECSSAQRALSQKE